VCVEILRERVRLRAAVCTAERACLVQGVRAQAMNGQKVCKEVNTFTMSERVMKFMNGRMNEFNLHEPESV
jgi:hypothetical protein